MNDSRIHLALEFIRLAREAQTSAFPKDVQIYLGDTEEYLKELLADESWVEREEKDGPLR